MKRPTLLFLTLFLVLSCGLPESAEPMPTSSFSLPPDGCVSSEATQKDIDRVLSITEGVLDPDEWERSYVVMENRVAVTWSSVAWSAVIYLEALIFPCGYDETTLDEYFSAGNWSTILSNYQGHESTGECRSADGARLYQFRALSQGVEYHIRYWAQGDTAARVIVLMAVFPVGSEDRLDEYSSRLFPRLDSCEQEKP